jgi:hypothetical protein
MSELETYMSLLMREKVKGYISICARESNKPRIVQTGAQVQGVPKSNATFTAETWPWGI